MIAGIDEAGRGPVIGPMVVCGVLLKNESLKFLKEIGVKDSKALSPSRREALVPLIMKAAVKQEVVEISPAEIDRARKKNLLNELEAEVFAKIIDSLAPKEAYVDSADPNPEKFKERLNRYLKHEVHLRVESFADKKYLPVSAASIVAKVRRDQRVDELRKQYGDFGSGYPADPRTREFLRLWIQKHETLPDFVRKSWKTLERL